MPHKDVILNFCICYQSLCGWKDDAVYVESSLWSLIKHMKGKEETYFPFDFVPFIIEIFRFQVGSNLRILHVIDFQTFIISSWLDLFDFHYYYTIFDKLSFIWNDGLCMPFHLKLPKLRMLFTEIDDKISGQVQKDET